MRVGMEAAWSPMRTVASPPASNTAASISKSNETALPKMSSRSGCSVEAPRMMRRAGRLALSRRRRAGGGGTAPGEHPPLPVEHVEAAQADDDAAADGPEIGEIAEPEVTDRDRPDQLDIGE